MPAKTTTKAKASARTKKGIDKRLVKALAHPLREQILIILNERMASPNELSKELEEGLSQVSYHVKVLKDFECIEMIKTEPRRGAVEHYYRATARPFLTDRDWKRLPASIRPGLSSELMQTVVDDASEALQEGTFDGRDDRHLSRTPLTLDEKGWSEFTDLLNEALDRMLEIQSKSVERLAKSDEEGFSVLGVLMGFEVPPAAQKRAKRMSKSGRKAKKPKAASKKA